MFRLNSFLLRRRRWLCVCDRLSVIFFEGSDEESSFLASENSGGLSGFQEALNDVYKVGSIVVKNLSSNWDTYANQIPSPASLPALPTVTKN